MVEVVLADFFRDSPDVEVAEGESFEHAIVEPLTRSLLEPRREGAPFTVQRMCELLAEPRQVYKSTRRYLYALQRSVLITATEEVLAQQQQRWQPPSLVGVAVPASLGLPQPPSPPLSGGDASNRTGKKRKLSPELSN